MQARNEQRDQASVTPAFFIESMAEAHARCLSHGLRIIKSLQDKEYGLKAFVFADPDGNRIDVGQQI